MIYFEMYYRFFWQKITDIPDEFAVGIFNIGFNIVYHKNSKPGIQTALSAMGYTDDGNVILYKILELAKEIIRMTDLSVCYPNTGLRL